jgi:hypothetical protein
MRPRVSNGIDIDIRESKAWHARGPHRLSLGIMGTLLAQGQTFSRIHHESCFS